MRSNLFHFAIVATALLVHPASATAQPGAFPWEGEVTGTNVYVRSGAGANWYPTTKLNTGDRVLVLGERYGWYRLAPPQGSFSFVDKAMVDRQAASNRGVIRQDKVYIRAGSNLSNLKNATQVVLNKGDAVDIQGEVEGFFKIAPPPGAGLFMSKQYVRPVSAGLATGLVERNRTSQPPELPAPTPGPAAAVSKPVPTPTQTSMTQTQFNADLPAAGMDPAVPSAGQAPSAASTERSAVQIPSPDTAAGVSDAPVSTDPNFAGRPGEDALASQDEQIGENHQDADLVEITEPTTDALPGESLGDEPAPAIEPATPRWHSMLEVLEGELVAMLNRPQDQQDPVSLRTQYEEIAAQTDEIVPAEIAKIRVRQLSSRADLQTARKELNKEEGELEAYRANMDAERMRIMRRRVEAVMARYDLEGELRQSFAFAPENRRYRLVDPQTNNTIAYVDVPRSVLPDAEHLVGRLVGIRAAGQSFSPSARVPIAVAGSVVDLSSRHDERQPAIPQIPLEEPLGPLGAANRDDARNLADAASPEPDPARNERPE